MNIFIPKSIIHAIKARGGFLIQELFGRFCKSSNIVQVASFEPKLGDVPLKLVGYWWGNHHVDPPPMTIAGAVHLAFTDSGSVSARFQQQPVDVHVYDHLDYHSRHRSLAISESSAGKKAFIVGLGSIGGKAAKELAKHGVEVYLFDLDTVEIANPYRLNLGLPLEFIVGLPKATATAEDISLSVPGAKVHAYSMDIEAQSRDFEQLIADHRPDIIVLSVDTRGGTRQANAMARHFNIPIFQVVLSDGAETGQIQFSQNNQSDACLLCIDPWAYSSDVSDTRRQYGEENSPSQKAVPALSIDTSIIAYTACKLIMAQLAGEDVSRYFTFTCDAGRCQGDVMWISTTPETWITDDFLQKVVARVEKTPGCPGCWTPDIDAIRRKQQQRKEQQS